MPIYIHTHNGLRTIDARYVELAQTVGLSRRGFIRRVVLPGALPGFLLGLWHGFIFPVAWVVSLFVPKVAIYAVPNNGGWYDFGYFLGIVVFGVGAKRGHTVYRDRVIYRDRG